MCLSCARSLQLHLSAPVHSAVQLHCHGAGEQSLRMLERSYSGMNSAYYVGIQSVDYYDPEDHPNSMKKRFDGKLDLLAQTLVTVQITLQSQWPQSVAQVSHPVHLSSDSDTSGSSSNTATQMTTMRGKPEIAAQELNSAVQHEASATQGLMASLTHQATLPQLDRPLPIRKRQRKPMKAPKILEVEAESFPVTSPNRRGRKPKAAGKTLPLPLSLLACLVCCLLYAVLVWLRSS